MIAEAGLPAELAEAVDPNLAQLLLAKVRYAPAEQLRHELRLLRDLLAAEKAKLQGLISGDQLTRRSTEEPPSAGLHERATVVLQHIARCCRTYNLHHHSIAASVVRAVRNLDERILARSIGRSSSARSSIDAPDCCQCICHVGAHGKAVFTSMSHVTSGGHSTSPHTVRTVAIQLAHIPYAPSLRSDMAAQSYSLGPRNEMGRAYMAWPLYVLVTMSHTCMIRMLSP